MPCAKGEHAMPYIHEIMKIGMTLPAGALHYIEVMHNDWCKIFNDEPCNCKPEIIVNETIHYM